MAKRKIFWHLFLACLFYQSLHAQKTLASIKVNMPSSTCEIMLDSLPKTPWAFREAALESVAMCVEKGSANEGRLCRQYALFHFNAARYKDALIWAKKEQQIYQTLGDTRKALGAQLISTQFHMSFGDNFRAYRIAKEIFGTAQTLGDTALMASASIALGMSSTEPSAQKQHYRRAIHYLGTIYPTNFVSLGTAHNNLASVFETENNLDSAHFHYQKALFYKKRNGILSEVAFNTLANLVKIQIRRGQYETASRMLDTAFSTAQKQGIMLGFYHIPLLLRRAECALEIRNARLAGQCFARLDSLMKVHPPYTPTWWDDYFHLRKTLASQQNDLSEYQYWDARFTVFSDSMNLHRDSVFASNLEILREIEAAEAEALQLRQISQFRIAIIAGLLLLLLSVWGWMRQRVRRKQLLLEYAQQQYALESLELGQLKVEAELKAIKQKTMEDQLEYTNRQLTTYTILMAKKSDFLRDLNEQLRQLPKYGQARQEDALKKIQHALDIEQGSDAEWEQFQRQFEMVHPTFFQQLRAKFDKFTTHDIKLCAFIKMRLDNKDIAKLMGINPASVLTSRYRLRKKIGLHEHEDLDAYISAL